MSSSGAAAKPRIGISGCLMGQRVRFDGQHKRDDYLMKTLGPFVEWVPVCPEIEVGMGVPRESVRLVAGPDGPRMIAERSGRDWTEPMRALSRSRVEGLLASGLSGYVTKKDSPSCGLERVRVYPGTGKVTPRRDGTGLFIRELIEASSLLPVEDEGRLNDPRLRDNFIERVFAYGRWQAFCGRKPGLGGLTSFHAEHKLSLMAHAPASVARLGRIVAQAKGRKFSDVTAEYGGLFMDTLRILATRQRHTNVLQHAFGYFSGRLDARERREMTTLFADYHRGIVPLVVPVTLVNHYVEKFEIAYLRQQYYFRPHPKELMLRNHV